jgi:hypothetical protein
MFGEFFNVLAIFVTNSVILLALSIQILPKSQFARCGVLAQLCFSALCLPMTKLFVGPVSVAVATLKERDGSFNFQVLDPAARCAFCGVAAPHAPAPASRAPSIFGSRSTARASRFTLATALSRPQYPKHSTVC